MMRPCIARFWRTTRRACSTSDVAREATMSYQPDPAFAGLFRAFTSDPESIGAHLSMQMAQRAARDPLIVSTGSDIVLFPGDGAAPRIESFRKSTRGFIELTAVSHLPLALAYLARMRELAADDG